MKRLYEIKPTPFAVDISDSSTIGFYIQRRRFTKEVQDVLMISELFIGFVQNRLIMKKEYCVGEMRFSFRLDQTALLDVFVWEQTYSFDKLESNYIASALKKLLSEIKFSKFAEYVDVLEDDTYISAANSYYR